MVGERPEPRRIELPTASFTLEEDGLVVVRMKAGASPTEREAREAIAAQRELSARPAPVLVDARAVRGMARAAQNRLAGPEHAALVTRMAIVVEGSVSVIVANMYLFVVRPPFPTRMFRDEAAARAWLSPHVGAARSA